METQPLLRLSLAILTIGSLLSIAIVNLVGSGGGGGGPWQGPLKPAHGWRGLVFDPGKLQILESHHPVA